VDQEALEKKVNIVMALAMMANASVLALRKALSEILKENAIQGFPIAEFESRVKALESQYRQLFLEKAEDINPGIAAILAQHLPTEIGEQDSESP
jgi:hypothetical protein